jgi:glycosyltransferase 2 family protein
MGSAKRWAQLLASLIISGAFIAYAVRGIDFAQVLVELKMTKYGYVIPSVLIFVAFQYLRAWRFKYLAKPIADMSFSSLVRISNIGVMSVLLLPVRLGEFVRPYLMRREYGASMTASLGAVAAERVIDGLVVTLGFFAVTRSGIVIPDEMSNAGLAAFLVFFSAATVLAVVLIGHEKGATLLRQIFGVFSHRLADKIVGMLTAFAGGLQALRSPRALVLYVAWTLFYWLLQGIQNWTLFMAMGIELPLIASYILVALTVIALMLPAGPGFIGPIQAAMVWGLGLFAVDKEKAFAFSILTHALSAAIQIVFGLVSLLTSHLSITSIVDESQKEAANAAPVVDA